MRELDRLLSVNRITFNSWQDADHYAVTNIFSFFEEMGNLSLGEVVNYLFQNREVSSNEFLSGINFNTSQELDLLDSIIDNYIETSLMQYDPQKLRGSVNQTILDKYVQAHQLMMYLISFCAIRIHADLQTNDQFKPFVNIMMTTDVVSKIVAKKQADYGPSNIMKFGIYGLVVRMHDKIGRLRNLVDSGKKNLIQDETVYDTLIDLVGYCTVSLMWINDWFLIPMDKNYNF